MKTCDYIQSDSLLNPLALNACQGGHVVQIFQARDRVRHADLGGCFFTNLVNLVPCHGSSRDVELAFIAFHNLNMLKHAKP